MVERLFFSKLLTKDLTAVDSQRRLFEGVLTVEMKDRQGEITVRDELLKVLPIWIARGGPITDTHSNRVVGRGINYAATTITDAGGTSYPAITIQGEIFKDYELDDEIWKAIQSGKYKGLSFGGATKSNRTPVLEKDGSVAYSLKDLEQYEVAVCEEPAVPLALITQHNAIAKAMAGKTVDRGNGQMCIICDKFKCYIDKNAEAFSDNKDMNTPQKDEQAEALENNRGEPQENGATYHGTEKARHSLDDGVYARKEEIGVDQPPSTDKIKDSKAIDEDNKELLDEAGLEEEKKLEHVDGHPEGPIKPTNKVIGAIAGAAGKVVSNLAEEGSKIVGSGVGSAVDEISDTCKALGETDNPGGAKYNQTNAAGDKVDRYGKKIPGVMSKKPKETENTDNKFSRQSGKVPALNESLSDFRSREGKPDYKPGARPDTIDNKNWLNSRARRLGFKKAIDILNLTLELKGLKGPQPSTRNVKDEVKVGYRSRVAPGIGSLTESEYPAGRDAALESAEMRHYDPDVAEKWKSEVLDKVDDLQHRLNLAILGSKSKKEEYLNSKKDKSDYNTDSVVREYEDEEDKKKAESRNTFTGEPGGGNWGREPGITRDDESKSPQEAIQPKHVNKPYDDDKAEALKNTSEGRAVGAHLDEAIGEYERRGDKHIPPSRVAQKNPTKEQKDESRAFGHNPKASTFGFSSNTGMQGTISRDTARKLKAAGDPQLQANNSEDGIGNKLRFDNDKEAEAFEKEKSTNINDPGHGSGGVRSGAAYDNAQQDTGAKDNPREVIEEEYTGEEDNATGASNARYNKANNDVKTIINLLNLKLKLL